MGQTITWMTPHQVGQVLAVDVDYRVMLTFLEFYIVLLRFVHFKLYHSLGLKCASLAPPYVPAYRAHFRHVPDQRNVPVQVSPGAYA